MDPNSQQPGQVFSPQGRNDNNTEITPPVTQEPANSLLSTTSAQPSQRSDPDKKRRIMIVIFGVLALAFMISVAVALLNSGDSQETPVDEQSSSQIQGPQPAQAIDVEQTNNSINNDLSGLDDNADFSKDDLSDDSLKL
jgi:hypothetical protein